MTSEMGLLIWTTKSELPGEAFFSHILSLKDWEIYQQMTINLSTAQATLTKPLPQMYQHASIFKITVTTKQHHGAAVWNAKSYFQYIMGSGVEYQYPLSLSVDPYDVS